MTTMPKNRKSDRYVWMKGVAASVVTILLVGVGAFVWNVNSTYAKKDEVKTIQTEVKELKHDINGKLDTIITMLHTQEMTMTGQKKDIEHLKESVSVEITRSKEVDKELTKRLRENR